MWLEQKVKAIDGDPEAWFGSAVAISGDTALVGAFNSTVNGHPGQGAVYAFRKVGDSWRQVQKLVASDGMASDQFGKAIAMNGDMAIITAPLATVVLPAAVPNAVSCLARSTPALIVVAPA